MPVGIAVNDEGMVYVADSSNNGSELNNRIQVFDLEGMFLREWGEYGEEEGEFDGPDGISIDGEGKVYVADTANHRIQVFDPEGRFLRKWGDYGDADGEFNGPRRDSRGR